MTMRALLFLFILLLAAGSLRAQEPQVQAGFSPDSAEVGETVQLYIEITAGGDDVERAPMFKVDGLDCQFVARTRQPGVRKENSRFVPVQTISYIYQVTPTRAGNFTVPAIPLQIGGRRYTTNPVALRVRPEENAADTSDRSGRAEIILPKKTAYVGETLLTELRLSVDDQLRARLESLPILEAEAFTKTKPGDVRTNNLVRNNRSYDVTSVRTALTPTKAGKLTVGPVEFQYVAEIPRPRSPGGPRSLLEQLLGNSMNGFSQLQQITATSNPVELNVKPLPIAGRPANFSGAVGQFTLRAQGSPAHIKMGDPITMTVTVSGTGSFDRVTAPVLAEAAGWRAYPPTSSYKGRDITGVNGTKNFEIAVIPEEKKQEMPVYEFSYFDPEAEKYVTLKSDRLPLQVEGEAPLTAPETRGPTQLPAPTPPPPKPTDIVGLRYEVGTVRAAQPMYSQRAFLLVQLVPFSLLCGMVAVRFRPRRREDRATLALRRERTELLARLGRERTRAGFFAAAARLLHVDASLRREGGAGVVELETADEAPIAREILENHAQAHYSGGAVPLDDPLSDDDRRRIVDALLPLLNRP
ncbi:MAG TPA: BatD family protein [Chthoniobacteraceae bacterium]|jgi:hypothetical protein|nr:BatD family protein [Chthoniobacteraceae bacterium]